LGAGAVGLAAVLWPLPERALSPLYSRVVLARDGSLLRAYLSRDEKWRFRARLDELPAHLASGLICLEDKRFFYHPGVDPLALGRALAQNTASRRVVSGASTLTMQVARLLEPRPRTLSAKILEAWLALRLESRFSKREILELYLSYAPFGANIEGIEAASQRYFLKSARHLSPSEAAFLLLLPQAPRRWEAREKVDLARLRNRNLERLRDCGVISEADLARFSRDPVPDWRAAFEVHAPHFADWVSAGAENQDRIVSTVDRGMQKSVEELVGRREARLRELGIVNVGLLAVDNATGEVRVAIGNFDYTRDDDGQKFASFLVPRSPGSLLKPFLFGRLVEAGQMLPETLLEDVPIDVKGYEPKNYNGEFQGLIEARLALAHSLNVPWVRALRDYGVEAFLDDLLSSGLQTPQKREEIGLSLVVGAMEANLKDLVMLYRALADDGRMRRLAVREAEAKRLESFPWMNPGAAHLVREALKIRGRPDFAIDPEYLASPTVRWKTGTSQGNRDAWAIGFDPEWTVGVWLGNLDQRASPSLVGPEVAAPLMFDALALLRQKSPAGSGRPWLPSSLETVEVCAFSGLPAGPSCRHRKQVIGIKGLALRKSCPYHHDILVDEKSGLRITKECETKKMRPVLKSALELSPDLADWARRHLSGAELSPAFHRSCRTRPVASGRLAILTPEPVTYVLHSAEVSRRGKGEPWMSLPLRLKSFEARERWRCFLNGRPVPTRSGAPEILLQVGVGDHVLLCSDEQGRSDQVAFSVER